MPTEHYVARVPGVYRYIPRTTPTTTERRGSHNTHVTITAGMIGHDGDTDRQDQAKPGRAS